jgi:hypothetical protein
MNAQIHYVVELTRKAWPVSKRVGLWDQILLDWREP